MMQPAIHIVSLSTSNVSNTRSLQPATTNTQHNQARQVKTHQRMQLPVAHSPESLGSARRNRIVVGTVELVDEQCTDEP